MFTNKSILITGGTGSFGESALIRFLNSGVGEVRIFSRDEKKQYDMRIKYSDNKIKFYIGDVRDFNSVNDAMAGVDFVFSAAALKQVPSCEFYPMEAIKTNTIGAENVLNAAINNHVRNVVFLSTDKAVYPINAMGMSKALMEKLVIAKARKVTKQPIISITRYGNVMASRGSVIPLFIEQIKSHKPITVTDPYMTRFMMSLDQSIDLVLFAMKNGSGGDIFIHKAPAATIGQLAETLKDIFNADNEIKIIGARHGEKEHETLANKEEISRSETVGEYLHILSDVRNLNYNQYFKDGNDNISNCNDFTSDNTYMLSNAELKDLLLNLDYIKKELSNV